MTREEIVREIEIFKKNNKAMCDITALYSHLLFKGRAFDVSTYTILEEVIKDLEDKDVNVSLKAKSIEELFNQDDKKYYNLLNIISENGYASELNNQLCRDYRTLQTKIYYNRINALKLPFDFIGRLCECNSDLISEILCSNMEMSKKVDILYYIVMYYIDRPYIDLEHILDTKGAGYNLSRTHKDIKEQKITELTIAFKEDTETERNLNNKACKVYDKIMKKNCNNVNDAYNIFNMFSKLQRLGLIDFATGFIGTIFSEEKYDVSFCAYVCYDLGINKLEDFEDFYQLDDYLKVDEKLRYSDSRYFLNNIGIKDISSFIALSNYEIKPEHIEIIGKRVLDYQKSIGEVSKDLVEEIKIAILRKAKNKNEYKTYLGFAKCFEYIADYASYKKQIEKAEKEYVKAREERNNELFKARYEAVLRLYNMNESLQEQVPGKTVIKNLIFKKDE